MNLSASREEVGKTQKSDGCGLNLSTLTSLGFSFHTSKNGVQGDSVELLSHPRAGAATQLSDLFLSSLHWPTLSSKTSVIGTLCQLNLRSPGQRL